jgi:hypothetical protein
MEHLDQLVWAAVRLEAVLAVWCRCLAVLARVDLEAVCLCLAVHRLLVRLAMCQYRAGHHLALALAATWLWLVAARLALALAVR